MVAAIYCPMAGISTTDGALQEVKGTVAQFWEPMDSHLDPQLQLVGGEACECPRPAGHPHQPPALLGFLGREHLQEAGLGEQRQGCR